jgi:hypothetical protein
VASSETVTRDHPVTTLTVTVPGSVVAPAVVAIFDGAGYQVALCPTVNDVCSGEWSTQVSLLPGEVQTYTVYITDEVHLLKAAAPAEPGITDQACVTVTNTSSAAPGLTLYVAPTGNDAAAGTISEPLRTLAGARDKIRALKEASGLPVGGIEVLFRGGTYPVTETTYLVAEDSGEVGSPIVYSAYPGETPVFSGGTYIPGSEFVPISSSSQLDRLSVAARDQVVEYPLFANGFTADELDYAKDFWAAGTVLEYAGGDYQHSIPRRLQVYVDDFAAYLARYPNLVQGTFEGSPHPGYLRLEDVLQTHEYGEVGGPQSIIVTAEKQRVASWLSREDVVITGEMGYEYRKEAIVADSIEPATGIIALRGDPVYPLSAQNRYAFENVFEELDTPGEYYIDKNTGILYLYPPQDLASAEVKITRFDENFMVELSGSSHVVFSGLTFELTKGSAILMTSGENVSVEDSIFKNLGVTGVFVGVGAWIEPATGSDAPTAEDNGFNHRITGSVFLNTGFWAARVMAGEPYYRVGGGFVFENNVVTNSGLLGSTYFSGLSVDGGGITVKNNTFAHTLGQAIVGNLIDGEIIYNEFVDCPSDMAEDTGTIYINYMGLNAGMKIRYNYFHDTVRFDYRIVGFDSAARGVGYYDNNNPGRDFSFNVVAHTPGSAGVSPQSPNTFINNLFVEVDSPFGLPAEWMDGLGTGDGTTIPASDDSIDVWWHSGLVGSELWRDKFPDESAYFDYIMSEKTSIQDIMVNAHDNISVNITVPTDGRHEELYPDTWGLDPVYGYLANNQYWDTDPGLVDYEGVAAQLTQEAADALGVERIDLSLIGADHDIPSLVRRPQCVDPMVTVPATESFYLSLVGGPDETQIRKIVIWREASPGCWVWEREGRVGGDTYPGLVNEHYKPGATYTIWYSGDSTYYPQFLGGLASATPGEPPTGPVTTFVALDPGDVTDFYLYPR